MQAKPKQRKHLSSLGGQRAVTKTSDISLPHSYATNDFLLCSRSYIFILTLLRKKSESNLKSNSRLPFVAIVLDAVPETDAEACLGMQNMKTLDNLSYPYSPVKSSPPLPGRHGKSHRTANDKKEVGHHFQGW